MKDLQKLRDSLNLEMDNDDSPLNVVRNIVSEIENITEEHVKGVLNKYDGSIESYTKIVGIAAIAATLTPEKTYNVQDDLGDIGEVKIRYEFCLVAPRLPHYKFRAMFFEYGIGDYPVKVVLEEQLAKEIFGEEYASYIVAAESREQLETLIVKVVNSDRIVTIIQKLVYASLHSRI